MTKNWFKATCGLGVLLGAMVACGDSETTETSTTANGGSTTTANGGSGGTASTGGMGGTASTGGSGGEGGAPDTLNGCTRMGATDGTGNGSFTINTISDWDFNHQACVVVDTNTDVVWEGNFGLHPLAGGEATTSDPNSPITGNTPANDEVTVSFPDTGVYPYFCTSHGASMQGVIYVE